MLDTSVLVAAVRSNGGASYELLQLMLKQEIEVALSGPLLYKYQDVLFRPEHCVENWTDDHLCELIDALKDAAVEVQQLHFSYRPILTDEGDELVLETAINGRASIIATLNVRDFEPARQFGIEALKPGEVMNRLCEGGHLHGEE